MQAYWGASAIMQRIGLRDPRRIRHYIAKYGLPAFPRRHPKHPRDAYYSDEGMINAWLLTRARNFREDLVAKEAEKEERKKMAQREKEKKAVA